MASNKKVNKSKPAKEEFLLLINLKDSLDVSFFIDSNRKIKSYLNIGEMIYEGDTERFIKILNHSSSSIGWKYIKKNYKKTDNWHWTDENKTVDAYKRAEWYTLYPEPNHTAEGLGGYFDYNINKENGYPIVINEVEWPKDKSGQFKNRPHFLNHDDINRFLQIFWMIFDEDMLYIYPKYDIKTSEEICRIIEQNILNNFYYLEHIYYEKMNNKYVYPDIASKNSNGDTICQDVSLRWSDMYRQKGSLISDEVCNKWGWVLKNFIDSKIEPNRFSTKITDENERFIFL